MNVSTTYSPIYLAIYLSAIYLALTDIDRRVEGLLKVIKTKGVKHICKCLKTFPRLCSIKVVQSTP